MTSTRSLRRLLAMLALALPVTVAVMATTGPGVQASPVASPLADSPIKHVVVIYQENHSFNELLGKLCLEQDHRCQATDVGVIHTGEQIPLKPEGDLPPGSGHDFVSQAAAIAGGKMNGWDLMPNNGGEFGGQGCPEENGYPCLVQAPNGAVPNLWTLAETYTISDHTFESSVSSSWGSHIDLVAATKDGFLGDQPDDSHAPGPGDGCDSGALAQWTGGAAKPPVWVPSCIPDQNGNGPFEPSPVPYVPTIMTRLENASLRWHIYAPGKNGGGYGWAICPTFYECLGSQQAKNVRRPRDFARDAAKGKLGALSIVIPFYADSQHNGQSLIQGDNWIAQNVQAVMDGPDWSSTAIFVTYDDCGCFYDPVAPPPGMGVRVPMVIVSPYAKPFFVDTKTASFASILAFTEEIFGLPPLGPADATAYDYADAFDFQQRPLPAVSLQGHPVPARSLRYMAEHPPDPNDPT